MPELPELLLAPEELELELELELDDEEELELLEEIVVPLEDEEESAPLELLAPSSVPPQAESNATELVSRKPLTRR